MFDEWRVNRVNAGKTTHVFWQLWPTKHHTCWIAQKRRRKQETIGDPLRSPLFSQDTQRCHQDDHRPCLPHCAGYIHDWRPSKKRWKWLGREQHPSCRAAWVNQHQFVGNHVLLVGGLEHEFYFPFQLGIWSSQLTFTPSFFGGVVIPPTRLGIMKIIKFPSNHSMVIHQTHPIVRALFRQPGEFSRIRFAAWRSSPIRVAWFLSQPPSDRKVGQLEKYQVNNAHSSL